MSDLASAAYSRRADLFAQRLRGWLYDAAELIVLSGVLFAIALLAQWAGA